MSTSQPNSEWSTTVAVGLPVGLAVFLLVVITATLITFILPESYLSSARIRIDAAMVGESPSSPAQPAAQAGVPPTELVVLTSQSVLQTVVTNLDLVDKWGRRYNAVGKLPASAAVLLLRKRLEVRPLPNTSIVEISALDESPVEAAELANAVAAAYIGYNVSIHSPLKARFLDSAVPATRPARPNKPLNLLLGVVIGLLLGAGTGCLCGIWLTARKRRG
jgi:uncharacterized protein involved in exopolysaccharide biosynthesis